MSAPQMSQPIFNFMVLAYLTVAALFAGTVKAAGPAVVTGPVEEMGNTPVLWLESEKVHSNWDGGNLQRITDEEAKTICLEWYQDPATKTETKLVLTGIEPSKYDALCLEWKYLGGGSSLIVTAGKRNWYLFKEKYAPGVWQEAWLDLNLDDDQCGPLLNEKGELVLTLKFGNLAQNRPDEQSWRRIRVKNLRLVKFPVRLTCDPKQVTVTRDDDGICTTNFPMRMSNTTPQEQMVKLYYGNMRPQDFYLVKLQPGETKAAPCGIASGSTKRPRCPQLYLQEHAAIYAEVVGDPNSRTTWFRGYVQWMVGGVMGLPDDTLKRPFMTAAGTRERVLERAKAYPWAQKILDRWIKTADDLLPVPWVVPELRHGYPSNHVCPEHKTDLAFDLVNFKRHFCKAGNHYLEGNAELDKEAAIRIHTRNSNQCRELGWAYYLTGNEAYARKAAELLLLYAGRFPSWEYADKRATGYSCRVGHAVLGECWWAHGVIQGYDFIAASPSLTADQRKTIENNLFLIEADDIQTHRVMYNQQAEINSASGEAAINAGNWYLAARAFTGNYGLFDQVDMAFSEEGFSLENDIAYHFAALLPIQEQGLVYEALGGKFFTPRVKRIYDAPLVFSVNPNVGNPAFYEIAYAKFKDPMYLPLLTAAREKGMTETTLIDGVFPLPVNAGPQEYTGSTLELAGRTVLRKGGRDDLRGVQIFWGSPTWRGGRDMLNFITSWHGITLNTSVTRISYGNPKAHDGLSYSTLGGNVPEVDGLQQSGIRPKQVVFRQGECPVAKYLAPPDASPYPGVGMSRVIAIVGDVYIVADRLTADRSRRLSFSFYPGVMVPTFTPAMTFAPYAAFPGEGETYDKIRTPERAACGAAFTLDYLSEKIPTRAHFLLDGDGELVKGVTYTCWNPIDTAVLLVRRQAPAAACVLALDAGKDKMPLLDLKTVPLTVNGKAVPMPQGLAVSITVAAGKFLLIDCDLPGAKQAAGIKTEDNLWLGKAE